MGSKRKRLKQCPWCNGLGRNLLDVSQICPVCGGDGINVLWRENERLREDNKRILETLGAELVERDDKLTVASEREKALRELVEQFILKYGCKCYKTRGPCIACKGKQKLAALTVESEGE